MSEHIENKFMSLISAYIEKFDVGPPVFGLDEDEAIRQMEDALESGEEIKGVNTDDVPPDALL